VSVLVNDLEKIFEGPKYFRKMDEVLISWLNIPKITPNCAGRNEWTQDELF